jgi:WD40 repeat protein
MHADSKKRRNSRRIIWLASPIFIIICYLLFQQLFYKSEQVNSNIFKLVALLPAHNSDILTVKFSPTSGWLASGSVDSAVMIWNKESQALIGNLKQPCGITYLDLSPNGSFMATAGYDEKVRLLQLPQGRLAKVFSGHTGTVWSLSFNPDGKTLASSGEDASIKVWDIETGMLLHNLQGHNRTVWDVKFSPDGHTIASGSFDKTIKIWEASTGKLLKTISDHSEAIVALAFSHDGKLLASTSDDKSIKLWHTVDWQLIKTLKVPEHVQAVDFSPNDKWLVTGGRDKPMVGEFLQNILGDSYFNKGVSMRLWEVETGKLLQTFSTHSNDVNDVSFSPDGKWIASGSSDKTIGLWRSN